MTIHFYAHTKDNEPPEHWQPLEDHLRRVAELARSFADKFGSGDWGYKAGLWHDIGKAHPDFQAYLFREEALTPRNTMIRAPVPRQPLRRWCYLCIRKVVQHYRQNARLPRRWTSCRITGLVRRRGLLPHRLENEKHIADTARNYAAPFLEALPEKLQPPAFAMHCRNRDAVAYHFWVRMLYSCLVDADFLDTEAFMDANRHAQRPAFPSLVELKESFDQKMIEMACKSPLSS